MGKKAKGHSRKKRHPGVGVPAQGTGATKERKMARKGRAAKVKLPECHGAEVSRVMFVPVSGPSRVVFWCKTCGRV